MQQKNQSVLYETFLNGVAEAQRIHNYCKEKVGECDKKTQDYLHQLELGAYPSRAKTATALAQCRKERRRYKDTMEILQPLIDLLADQQAISFVKKLQITLGETRKIERAMKNRQYIPRVVTDLEITKEKASKQDGKI